MKVPYTLLAIFMFTNAIAQCPPEGTGRGDKEQELNREKNKPATRPSTSPTTITIDEVLSRRKDEDAYTTGEFVKLVDGYVVSAEEQGPETCNCGLASAAEKDGDIHIYIGRSADDPIKSCMVVEITPSWKETHQGYDKDSWVGKKVTVMGYLLYDYKHKGNSVNYCVSCKKVWRKTCWEIHPITTIAVSAIE